MVLLAFMIAFPMVESKSRTPLKRCEEGEMCNMLCRRVLQKGDEGGDSKSG